MDADHVNQHRKKKFRIKRRIVTGLRLRLYRQNRMLDMVAEHGQCIERLLSNQIRKHKSFWKVT